MGKLVWAFDLIGQFENGQSISLLLPSPLSLPPDPDWAAVYLSNLLALVLCISIVLGEEAYPNVFALW